MALTSSLKLNINATETNPLDLGTGSFQPSFSYFFSLGSGTGDGQADRLFTDTRTLAPSTGEDLDLNGVLVNAYAVVINLLRVKVIAIKAAAANANNLLVSRPAATGVAIFSAASDEIVVRPGGLFCWAATDATAIAVGAASSDLLHVTNGGAGTSVTYDVLIIGCSA